MSDKKQYYNQCFWHADGSLKCKKEILTYDPKKYQNYVEFDDFSTPNENYKPNEYRNNLDFYEKPYKYDTGVSRNIHDKDYFDKKKWLSPPQTKKKIDSFNKKK